MFELAERRSASAGGKLGSSRSATPPPPSTTQEIRYSRSGSAERRRDVVQRLTEETTASFRASILAASGALRVESAPTSATSSRRPSPSPRLSAGAAGLLGGHLPTVSGGSLPSSRTSSPSREQYKKAIKATYFGFASEHPNEADLVRHQQRALQKPPRLVDVPLDPKFHHYRGYAKCRHCSAMVLQSEMTEHCNTQCPLAPVYCPLVDSELGVPCGLHFRGRQSLHEHLLVCPMRTKRCENRGCSKQVSVQSVAAHGLSCQHEPVRCVHCHVMSPRGEAQRHALVCPMVLVDCPLGCGESLRRSEITSHIEQTAQSHKPQIVDPAMRPPEDPHSVIHQLLARIVDMHHAAQRRFGGSVAGSAIINASLVPSRSATPTGGIVFSSHRPTTANSAPLDAAAGAGRREAYDEPPSTIHGDNTDDVMTHEDGGGLLGRSADSVFSATSHPPLHNQDPIPSTSSLSLRTLLAERPTLSHQGHPVQSVPFLLLQQHLESELRFIHSALDQSIVELPTNKAVSSDELNALLQSMDTHMQSLLQLVGAFTSRSNFEGLPKAAGVAAQDAVNTLWKSCDRVWYEWKLVMYERMYLGG